MKNGHVKGSCPLEGVDGEESQILILIRTGISLILAPPLPFSFLSSPLCLMCGEQQQPGGNRDKEVREREERKY